MLPIGLNIHHIVRYKTDIAQPSKYAPRTFFGFDPTQYSLKLVRGAYPTKLAIFGNSKNSCPMYRNRSADIWGLYGFSNFPGPRPLSFAIAVGTIQLINFCKIRSGNIVSPP